MFSFLFIESCSKCIYFKTNGLATIKLIWSRSSEIEKHIYEVTDRKLVSHFIFFYEPETTLAGKIPGLDNNWISRSGLDFI